MADVDTPPDAKLLAAARQGDAAAFAGLVTSYRRELYAYCYRMLGSVEDAEDALQEGLLAAWRGLAGFEARSSLRAWLYRVTTNACLRLNRPPTAPHALGRQRPAAPGHRRPRRAGGRARLA